MTTHQLGLFDHLTHKANVKHTRYGWLRLTPAYSVHLVEEILSRQSNQHPTVLDPFCGTGTTALVCAERGIYADTIDINPFLLWLTNIKTELFNEADLEEFKHLANYIIDNVRQEQNTIFWTPSLHQIEKWWEKHTLQILSTIFNSIKHIEPSAPSHIINLIKVVFCRILIQHSNASFNHQSMSFKPQHQKFMFNTAIDDVSISWRKALHDVYEAAKSPVQAKPGIFHGDARSLSKYLTPSHYTCIITSPPYPNRMSYIRELRPYMYWLGYLNSGREAGELDWQAIGGTWGVATSHVSKWQAPLARTIPFEGFDCILEQIKQESDVLSRYVHKYFYDMVDHINELWIITAPGGSINYIVGNSKFYDVLLPVEEIFAALFRTVGFINVEVRPIRKRTSKKELYEYIVSGIKP